MNVGELKKYLEEHNIPDYIELHHREVCDYNEEIDVSYYPHLDQLEFWVRKKKND